MTKITSFSFLFYSKILHKYNLLLTTIRFNFNYCYTKNKITANTLKSMKGEYIMIKLTEKAITAYNKEKLSFKEIPMLRIDIAGVG